MATTNKEFEVRHGLVVAATTSATSTTTGSLITRGGAGIAENLYVGGNLFVTGTVSSTSTNATSVTVNNDNATADTHFLTFVNVSTGEAAVKVDNSDLFYQPSTGSLGVGTSTFLRKFAVNGTAEVSSDFFVGGNSTFTGDLAVNGGDITTSSATLNIGNTATTAQTANLITAATASGVTKTVNLGTGAAAGSTTNINIGSTNGGTTTITSPTTTLSGNLTVSGGTITAGNVATGLLGGNTTTAITFAGAQTSGTLTIGGTAQTGTITIDRSASAHTLDIGVGANASGVTKTVNFGTGGAAGSTTNINIGSTGGGTTTINSPSVVLQGSLIVNGTTTTVNSSTLTVDDKNIELGSVEATTVSTTGTIGSISGTGPWTATITGMTSTTGLLVGSAIAATNGTGSLGAAGSYIVASIVSATSITFTATGGTTPVAGTVTNITTTGATDVTANGGGITLRGATDKTINWLQSTGRWTFNQPVEATSIQNTPIGSTAASTGRFTTVQSTVATGTAPLTVASTTLVTNLNADLLDGNHASSFFAFGTLTLDTTDSGYSWTNADATSLVADTLSDTLSVVQGSGIQVSVDTTNDAIRIAHADTSSVANLSSDNASNTFIQDVSFTFDEFGHVTAASVSTGTVSFAGINTFSSIGVDNSDTGFTWNTTDTSTVAAEATSDTLTLVAGVGIDLATDATSDAIRISHEDTSSVVDVTAATNVFVSGITFDTFGHVQTITTGNVIAFPNVAIDNTNTEYTWVTTDGTTVAAESANDTLRIVAGGAIQISADATNDAILISHSDTSSVANLSSDNSSNTFIQDVSFTFDTYGHVTAASVTTGTVSFAGVNTFSSIGVDNSDTGFTWSTADTSTVAAEATSDTLTLVAGVGIDLATDATSDAIRISHEDTSAVANVTAVANTFVSAVTFDTFGHVQTITTAPAVTYTLDGNSSAANSVDLQLLGSNATTDSINVVGTGSTTVSWDEGNQRLTINSTNTAWVRRTSAYTAVPTDKIIADTSGGTFTITLPAAPTVGTSVMIADGDNWNTNNLIVARNGSTIEGVAQDITLNIPGIQTEFIYDGTTWEVYAFTGPAGVDVTDDNLLSSTVYPLWASAASGFLPTRVSSTKMYFVPSTGTLSTVDYNSLSDRTLKENITPIVSALDIVEKIKPVSFDWKDTGKHAYGVIAQEIEEILPEIVQTHPDTEIKSVSYMQLVPILLQAIKELKEEIKILKDSK